MNDAKQTPGPWHVKHDGERYHVVTNGGQNADCIASFHRKDRAVLIAAAPDLLAALKDLLGDGPDTHEVNGRYECRHCGREWSAMCGDNEVPENCPSDDCPGHIARAAIAKATT